MEDFYGHDNPLNSVTKLHALVTRCPRGRTPELDWTLSTLWDLLASKHYDPKTLSVSAIKGTNNGNRGIVSLLLLKRDLNIYFTDEVLTKKPFSLQAKLHFPKVFADVESYRTMLKARPGSPEPNLDWSMGLGKADGALRDFWEAFQKRTID